MMTAVNRLPYSKMVQLTRLSRETGVPCDLLRRVIKSLDVKTHRDGRSYFIFLKDRERVLSEANRLITDNTLRSAHRNMLIDLRYKENYVYFFRSGAFIKIGTADNVHRRRKELQVGNPTPITVPCYIIGTVELEEQVQSHFGDLLVQGEWYREEGELAELIAQLSAEAPPVGTTARFRDLWRYRDYTESRRNSRNLDFSLQAIEIKGE